MSEKKIKTSELKNSLFSDRERMELWVAANWKKCVVVAVLLIIATGIGVTWYYINQKKEEEFRQRLNTVPAEQLAAVIAERPDHEAVPAARIRLADALWAKGSFKEAKAEFDKVAANAKAAGALSEKAKISSAMCLEQLGDKEGALKGYLAIVADLNNSQITRCEAGVFAARFLMAKNDRAGAEKVLNDAAGGNKEIYESMAAVVGIPQVAKQQAVKPQEAKKPAAKPQAVKTQTAKPNAGKK